MSNPLNQAHRWLAGEAKIKTSLFWSVLIVELFLILSVPHCFVRAVHASGVNPGPIAGCNSFGSMCQGVTVTITSANIIGGIPVTIVPAAGADAVVMLTSFAMEYVAGTNAFSQDYNVVVQWAGTTSGCTISTTNLTTSATTSQFVVNTCFGSGAFVLPSLIANQPMMMSNANGPSAGGNGSIIVTPIYTVVRAQ